MGNREEGKEVERKRVKKAAVRWKKEGKVGGRKGDIGKDAKGGMLYLNINFHKLAYIYILPLYLFFDSPLGFFRLPPSMGFSITVSLQACCTTFAVRPSLLLI